MKPKTTYLLLCLLGVVTPYWKFLPWVAEHGLNLTLFWREMFANRISGFFALDVIVSALVLIAFVRKEGSRLGIRRSWLTIAATLTVGVSLGFPLFLYLREAKLESSADLAQS